MSRDAAMSEVRAAMAFYTARGWDWLDVVGFICWKTYQRARETPADPTEGR